MHLRDLKLRAMDGSVLVEGELAIVSDEPAARLLPSSRGRLVGVSLRQGLADTATFHLYEQTIRVGDGFYAATPPILTLRIEDGLPDLRGFYLRSATRRQRLQSDSARLATLSARYPTEDGAPRELLGRIDDITSALSVEEDGLLLNLDGALGPMKFHDESGPRIEKARLVGRLLIPRAYCLMRRLSLGFAHQPDARVGEWKPWGPGLGSAPMSAYATLFCPGRLTWDVPSGGRRPPSGHVSMYLDEHRLVARPVGEIDLLASGFASERNYLSDGPELELGIGYVEWARMLETADEAEMEWRGVGIGHVDGQTGRSVGECGGSMRQHLSALQLRLKRSGEGLHVRGRGKLVPLAADRARSLGPDLAFEFLLPRGWILARGLGLRFWQDWRKDFPNDTAW